MKIHTTFFIVLLFIFFSACEQKTKTIPEKQQQEVSEDSISLKVNSNESELAKEIHLTSKLKEKVTRLTQLIHAYQLKSLEIVPAEKTVLIGRLQHVLKLKDSLAEEFDLSIIKSDLHEIRKSFLKGTKPMQYSQNTYPRVTIEEYIFKTTESANAAYKTLMKSKKSSGLWTYVSKSPNALFVEENKLYFVDTGGYYMMKIYKDIVEKVKN